MPINKKKILITGFEAFDGDSVNPSALFLEWIKKKNVQADLCCVLLPVSFSRAYQLLAQAIAEFNPTQVLLCGLAKNRQELTLERVAINWMDARIADNDGKQPLMQKITEAGEDGLFSTLPVVPLIKAAQDAGCPTKLSTTAGEYVCNQLMYLFLYHHRNIPGTFIHIPGQMDVETSFKGLYAMITELCEGNF